ncbi:hypothetical protein [Kordia sp.]|uniref:hypothetical protein n=1 Tax=Kordia sp. TaxID=1965332 RepID=UPI003D2A4AE8
MKKRNLKCLTLNKKSISNLDENVNGGKAGGSGVYCVTQVGSCQTTSCVCTNNQHCLTWTCPK